MKTVLASVMALTLMTMTVSAGAEEAAPPTSATVTPVAPPPPAAASATPLATRPSRPLTLAPANEGTPFGYKLLAGVGVAVAAGLWLRKRRGAQTAKARSRIDVLGRTSVGVRNELLVVDVEGTRLLVGMTPSSIQTLAVLEMPEAAADAREVAEIDDELEAAPAFAGGPRARKDAAVTREEAAPVEVLGERVRSLLASRRQSPARASAASTAASESKSAARPRRTATTPKTPRVAGQAKGLLLALEEPPSEKETAKAPIRLGDW